MNTAQELHFNVATIFELESYKLGKDDLGNPMMTIPAWNNIAFALSCLNLPKVETPSIEPIFTKSSSLIELNETYIEKLIENVYIFSFENFYPEIICRLNLTYKDMHTFEYIVTHKSELKKILSKQGYHIMKTWVNYYYGIIGSTNPIICDTIKGTGRSIMEKMIAAISKDNVIFADTDEICFVVNLARQTQHLDNIKLYADYLQLPYSIEHYDGIIPFRKKKHILFKSLDGVHIRGFKKWKRM